MRLYRREKYLKKIRGFYHDSSLIKVVTGIRRCGKSCLLETIMEELGEQGVPEKSIIYLNLDKRGYRNVKTPDQLESVIDGLCQEKGMKYLFIDEIQNVEGFEEVLNAFREEDEYSIFITGSNSYLLSGELVIKDGGFPQTLKYEDASDKREYVNGIIAEIFEKDIRRRVKVRNRSTFNTVQTYIINNFGCTTSLTNILNDLRRNGSDITRETLNRYIQVLVDAKILYKCERFDLKSRKSISGEQKYYLADLGFYFATNTDNRINYGPVLENIVYIYARSKGYAVSIGRIGKLECDFVLRSRMMQYSYIQVCMTILNSRETEDREYRPLESIPDNYPKYLVTRNDLIQQRNGIIHVNIGPFMGNGSDF